MCGVCAQNCPAQAISLQSGKDHVLCRRFLDKVTEENLSYHGCGKCQTAVPCESRIPNARHGSS
jgi:epoxyqueuosine reductase QueG